MKSKTNTYFIVALIIVVGVHLFIDTFYKNAISTDQEHHDVPQMSEQYNNTLSLLKASHEENHESEKIKHVLQDGDIIFNQPFVNISTRKALGIPVDNSVFKDVFDHYMGYTSQCSHSDVQDSSVLELPKFATLLCPNNCHWWKDRTKFECYKNELCACPYTHSYEVVHLVCKDGVCPLTYPVDCCTEGTACGTAKRIVIPINKHLKLHGVSILNTYSTISLVLSESSRYETTCKYLCTKKNSLTTCCNHDFFNFHITRLAHSVDQYIFWRYYGPKKQYQCLNEDLNFIVPDISIYECHQWTWNGVDFGDIYYNQNDIKLSLKPGIIQHTIFPI
jgi:hypothetical protein